MNNFEKNIINSFNKVKEEILNLQTQLVELSAKNDELFRIIEGLNVEREIKEKLSDKTSEFVASKEGKKFHIKECPFAKQINEKSKIVFSSKQAAIKQGYKACNCIK